MVLGDPLLLVTTCAGCGDSTNRSTDLGGSLTLLGLRGQRDIRVVAREADEGKNNKIGRDPRGKRTVRRKGDS